MLSGFLANALRQFAQEAIEDKTRGKSARKKMDVERIRQKFDAAKSKHNIYFEAKEEQLKIAMTVMGGRNVLGLLPTGYGKTLCMLIPTMPSEA